MAIENRPKITKSSFAASVPLSKMLKLGKIIALKVDIATLLLEEFSLTEMRSYILLAEVHCGLWRCWAMSNFFFQIFLYSYVFSIL